MDLDEKLEMMLEVYGNLDTLLEAHDIDPIEALKVLFRNGLLEVPDDEPFSLDAWDVT